MLDNIKVEDVLFLDIERIVRYCEKDVLAIVQVLLRFMSLPAVSEEKIESVTFL